MGLLDVSTVLVTVKTTRQGTAVVSRTREIVHGYEIHHGLTTAGPAAVPELDEGLGWRTDNVAGVYLHGLFDDAAYVRIFLSQLGINGDRPHDRHAAMDAELSAVAAAVATSGFAARVLSDLVDQTGFVRTAPPVHLVG